MTSFENRTTLRKIIFLLLVIIAFSFGGYYLGRRQAPQELQEAEELATPTAVTQLNEDFEFSIDEAPEEDAHFKIILVEAKKVKLVTTQGDPIRAETGREFLILSLEIENDNTFPFEINSQHYFRLRGEEDKSYAPDFYNESIEIPPVSTKRDELGFVVSAEQKQFKLLVGPIVDEEREEVEINF